MAISARDSNRMVPPSTDYPQFIEYLTSPRVQVFLAALILCGILLFNAFFYVYQPYDGMQVYQEGPLGGVYVVYAGGPADLAGVQIGDQILSIANKPVDPLRKEPRYPPGLKPGDLVEYDFQREGEQISRVITLGSYLENINLLGSVLGMQFLSIALWIIGLVLALFVPPDDIRVRIISLGFLLAGLTTAVGGASGWNSFWGAATIQLILLCLLAAILVAAHLTFPTISFPIYRNRVINTFFAIGCILSVLVIIDNWLLTPRGISIHDTQGVYLRQWVLVYFMLAWLVATALLIRNRYLSDSPDIRRQTGIIIWGMVLGIGPFFVFKLLPYLLIGEEYLPGFYTILFLILLPLAYAYVIFQRRLLRVDFVINRILVSFILVLLILIVSVLVFGIIVIIYDLPSQVTFYGGLVAVLIALPFTSLSRLVQQKVDQVLYGGHYDYAIVTSSMSNQLAQTLDRNRLVELLTQQLPQQMGILQAALWLTSGNRLVSNIDASDRSGIPLDDLFCIELLKFRKPMRTEYLQTVIPLSTMAWWEEFAWGQVFILLVFESRLQGLVILGQRTNGDVYSDQDLCIISTVAEQGALAAANITLYEIQRALARQLVRSDEEQRKQLAGDLHDTILQELFYIKQSLHRKSVDPELMDNLEESINNLRQMIKAQRPTLLDQGLPLALEGLVKDMQKISEPSTAITWQSDVNGAVVISDEHATSIFRIAQEAIHNAIKHACARHIAVNLALGADRVLRLQVIDDGKGALQMTQEAEFDANHFGLALMHERAQMIGAELRIQSQPGQGTSATLEVPL